MTTPELDPWADLRTTPTVPDAGELPEPPRVETGVGDVPLDRFGKPDRRTRAGRAAAGLPPKPAPPNKGTGRRGAAATTRKAPVAARGATDYRPGINNLGQMVAFGLSFAAPADAAAIMVHTPPIAEALNNLAAVKPDVAAVLDRLMSAGPYGEIMLAVTPLIVQIMVNHHAIPAGLMGTSSPDDLIKMVSS